MGVEQRAGPGTNPRISRVVSKSDIVASGRLIRQQNPWANARGYYLP